MANKRLKVGDVVRWKNGLRDRWPKYPEPLVVVQAGLKPYRYEKNNYVTVKDASGKVRNYDLGVPFSPDWFELDPFLTAVHQRRKHGK